MIIPNSQMDKDIRAIAREIALDMARIVIKNELRLNVHNPGGSLVIDATLNGEVIGKATCIYNEVNYIGDDEIDVEFKVD